MPATCALTYPFMFSSLVYPQKSTHDLNLYPSDSWQFGMLEGLISYSLLTIECAASQRALPLLQSAHIARWRDVSFVVNVRVTLPHGESRESYLACVDMIDDNRLSVLSSGACHMCVDLPIAASQKDLPLLQSTHIARRRDVSGVVIVRVTLPHRESRESLLCACCRCTSPPDCVSSQVRSLRQSLLQW